MSDEKTERFTHIDLFSGIGGFTLAGEWAGFETIVFCERDKFCQRILRKHWPEIPTTPEIRDFNGTKWMGATLLTGGFPCQPFSVAGRKRGKEDDRYLWPEMLRIISEGRPRWILAENVLGIAHLALDTVLTDLEDENYAAEVFIIPACAVDAPHRRDRVWIIAHSEDERTRTRPGQWEKNGFQRRGVFKHQDERRNPVGAGGVARSRNSTKWRGNWLEIATRLCRVDDGVPDRVHRLKALGNAIVPQVAYEILKKIVWIERNLRA